MDRRSFLALSSLFAGGAADEATSLFATDGGSGATPVHDHSAPESGGSTLRPDGLVTAETPVVDVRAHGATGDGETDDSDALQAAVDAATPHGVVLVPYDVVLRLEGSVDVDLSGPGGQSRFAFLCQGALQPAPGLGDAVHVHGGLSPYVFARVEKGGSDPETDTAFKVTQTRGGLFEGFAQDYGGTLFEFQQSGTYSVGNVRTWNSGQSVAVYDASPMGEIRDVFDVSPVRAPEFHDSSDVCINQYENYMAQDRTARGVLFENCLSVWADKIAVGGSMETPACEFRACDHMFVNALHLGGALGWGGVIEDTIYSTFRVFCNVNNKGLKYAGASDGNRIVLNAQNIGDVALRVTEDVTGGYHYVAGNIVQTGARAVDVRSSDAEVHLDNLYAWRNAGGDLRVPEENEVRLTNSKVDFLDGTPKLVNGVGTESADRDLPDERNWRVGHRVDFTDTGDGSGTGYYELTHDGWRRLGPGPDGEAPTTTTAGGSDSPTQTATATEASDGVPGLGVGTAATAVGVAGVRLLRGRDGD
jgi:hypothetical protein